MRVIGHDKTSRNRRSGARPDLQPTIVATSVCLGVFVVLTALVAARWLAGLDFDVAVAAQAVASPALDAAASFAAIGVAFEASIVYAAVASLVLWRLRLGKWALLPYTFVALTMIEVAMKLTLPQPDLPRELQRTTEYPFTVMSFSGSYPSGHAIRSAFFSVFAAGLLWRHGGVVSRTAATCVVGVGLLFGLSRVYLGQHWLTDVIAGMALGAGAAFVAARIVATHVRRDASGAMPSPPR